MLPVVASMDQGVCVFGDLREVGETYSKNRVEQLMRINKKQNQGHQGLQGAPALLADHPSSITEPAQPRIHR